jgi:hypothetical protein
MALADKPSVIKTSLLPDDIYDGIVDVLQGRKSVVGRNSNLTPQDRSIKDKCKKYELDTTLGYYLCLWSW